MLRILIKWKIFQIPGRCSKCNQIKWGRHCDNLKCNIQTEVKWFGFYKRTYKNISLLKE